MKSIMCAVALLVFTVAADAAHAQYTSTAWDRAVNQFVHTHPALNRGANMQIMQRKIKELDDGQISNWMLLQNAYAHARFSPGWTARTRAYTQASPTYTPPMHTGGIGASAYDRGAIVGLRCTRANGQVYYAAGVCGYSVTPGVTAPPSYTVTDPNTGRVIRSGVQSRHEIYDPVTGRYLQPYQLNWSNDRTAAAPQRVPDTAQRIPVDTACSGARTYAEVHDTARARGAVQALCEQGRSLYNQQPSNDSLYGPAVQGH